MSFKKVSYFLSLIAMVVLSFAFDISYLMGNTLYELNHDPFDGFVSPVSQTVDWIILPSNLRYKSFHEVSDNYKIELPKYDSRILTIPSNTLDFRTPDDVLIRNTQISYSVPYLGNYKFDGVEKSGSHPGVDLKLLKNTPIQAISNGIVYKAEKTNVGLGNYIVILHKNVPDPNNPTKEIDIYSTYAHLDRILVKKGQRVSKSELIAFSGKSGLATTAHLDFQINTSDVPFVPYWPFNAVDISKQNMDFVTAVNSAVGYDEALKYTINPFKYIQEFKDFSWNTVEISSELDKYKTSSVVAASDVLVSDYQYDESSTDLLEVKEVYVPNNIQMELLTSIPDFVRYQQSFFLKFKSENKIASDLLNFNYNSDDMFIEINSINNNFVELKVTPLNFGLLNFSMSYDSKFINDYSFKSRVFTDVPHDSVQNVSLKNLYDLNVLQGFSDGSINLYSPVTKMESILFLTRLIDPEFKSQGSSWYYDYYQNALNENIINPDSNIFTEVNNLEFLKMFFTYLDLDLNQNVNPMYENLFSTNEWYSIYLQEAYRKNIISASDMGTLNQPLSRGQLFRMLSRVSYLVY